MKEKFGKERDSLSRSSFNKARPSKCQGEIAAGFPKARTACGFFPVDSREASMTIWAVGAGFIWLTCPHYVPSLEEVRTGTQIGQEPGGKCRLKR